MAFFDRDFDVYVILGDAREPQIWTWPSWGVVVEALTPLVRGSRGRAAVRTTQFDRDGKTPLRFGRIGWNNPGHKKWVHGSPANAGASGDWRFLTAEVWAPAWSTCEQDGRPPDVFVGIRNEAFWNPVGEVPKFNPVLLLAVASDLSRELGDQTLSAVQLLCTQCRSVLAVHQRRPWGKPMGCAGFTDAIQDLISVGLFALGQPHGRPVDEKTFVGSWTRLQ